MEISNEKEYIYPSYVTQQQLLKGMYIYEWFISAAFPIVGILIFSVVGFVVGAVIFCLIVGLLMRMNNNRTNLLGEMMSASTYFLTQQLFIKKHREIEEENDKEVLEHKEDAPIDKKHKKKKKSEKKKNKKTKKQKHQQKQKEKNMQDLFPFKRIDDSMIEMENNDIFLYLRIQSNNLDLLSLDEINKMIQSYSKNIDRDKFKVSYFIQDSVFKIQGNINAIQKAKEKQKIPFLSTLLDQMQYLLVEKKDNANKKFYCIRIKITAKERKNINFEEIKGRIKTIYKNSLNPIDCTKSELKQMLAIFGNRIFADDLPDTEYEEKEIVENNKNLLVKKKVSYKESQLPGVYDFKDMIVPVTAEFKPSSGMMGRNIVKTYGVSSFLGTTKETNLLASACNIPGVTTSIYIDKLSIRKYKNNMRQDIKSQRSAVKDDVDLMDFENSAGNLASAYKKTLKENQNMYYISIYFMITAKTQREFSDIEEQFLSAIDDVSITLDDLKSKQKEAYFAVSPIGKDYLGNWIKQNIPSESFANLYPFNEPSLMDDEGLYIGNIVDKKNPVLFNPFTYRGTNSNILILGMSGVGKTILMMLILMNAASMGAYIRNIDFEGTQIDFIKKLGGINIDIAGGDDFVINPLQVRIPYEIRRGILDDYIGEVKSWMRIYKSNWNDDLLDLFEEYLRRTYEAKGISNDTDFKSLRNTDYPLLSDVNEMIEKERDHYDPKASLATEEELRRLLLGMKSAVTGADANIFNRHTYLGQEFKQDDYDHDAFDKVRIINFDFSRMMNSDMSRKLAQWTNIFTYITQFVNNNMTIRDDIIVSIDELHEILKKEYMPIINIISSNERRFRKYNTCFLKATQTMDEVDSQDAEMESKVKPLFSQSAMKFLFHLGDIDYEKPKRLMNLTKSEIAKIQENRSGECLVRVNKTLYDLDVFMPEWFSSVKRDA